MHPQFHIGLLLCHCILWVFACTQDIPHHFSCWVDPDQCFYQCTLYFYNCAITGISLKEGTWDINVCYVPFFVCIMTLLMNIASMITVGDDVSSFVLYMRCSLPHVHHLPLITPFLFFFGNIKYPRASNFIPGIIWCGNRGLATSL